MQVHVRGGGVQTIPTTHETYDPLHYVLFYPQGGTSWHDKPMSPYQHKGRVTISEYYRYLALNHNALHAGGRLYLQYLVDMVSKMEAHDLKYITDHHQELRADLYANLADAMADGQESKGRQVILPSSFHGFPRQMRQRFQDAMCVQRTVGTFPALFVTMTCNSFWKEIVAACGGTHRTCCLMCGTECFV